VLAQALPAEKEIFAELGLQNPRQDPSRVFVVDVIVTPGFATADESAGFTLTIRPEIVFGAGGVGLVNPKTDLVASIPEKSDTPTERGSTQTLVLSSNRYEGEQFGPARVTLTVELRRPNGDLHAQGQVAFDAIVDPKTN